MSTEWAQALAHRKRSLPGAGYHHRETPSSTGHPLHTLQFPHAPTPPLIVLKVTLQDAISISGRRGLRCSEVQQITKWGQGGRSGFQAQVCRMPLSFLLLLKVWFLDQQQGHHIGTCVCVCVFSVNMGKSNQDSHNCRAAPVT